MNSFTKGVLTGTTACLACFTAYKFTTKDGSSTDIDFNNNNLEDINKLEASRNILKYGVPNQGPYYQTYSNHALAYNYAKRTPIWVAELLTQDTLKGVANRKHSKFKSDPNIPSVFSAENSDYLGSGWSRGHMAPAGDNKISQISMDETFYLSNIVPQNLDNNAGFWNRFEMYCRDLTKKFKEVRVISGPLVIPQEDSSGKKFVTYQVIGNNDVAVPTHLYKVLLVNNDSAKQQAIGAFIVPNKPISIDHELTEFQVKLSELQQRTGLIFFPNFDAVSAKNLCTLDGCKLMTRDEFESYILVRRLYYANSVEKLKKTWQDVEKKRFKPTNDATNTYLKKKRELESEDVKRSEL